MNLIEFSYLYLIMGSVAGHYIYSGIKQLRGEYPLLISLRRSSLILQTLLLLLIFVPQVHRWGDDMFWASVFFFISAGINSFISAPGYVVYGANEKIVKDAVRAVLKNMNIEYQEALFAFKIPSRNLELIVARGVFKFESPKAEDSKLLHEIAAHVERYFKENKIQADQKMVKFKIIFGILVLMISLILVFLEVRSYCF